MSTEHTESTSHPDANQSGSTTQSRSLAELLADALTDLINELLATDPANATALKELDGQALLVRSQEPDLCLRVEFEYGELTLRFLNSQVAPENMSPADIDIEGKAVALVTLLTRPVDNAAQLRQAGLRVSGDVSMLMALSQLAEKIDIDWTEWLSKRIGETPAVIFTRVAKLAGQQGLSRSAQLKDKVEQHLVSEQSPFLTQTELAQFKSKLRDLHYRIDRLDNQLRRARDRTD